MSNTRKANTPALDPLAIIASARLPEKVVPLCLRGDLVAEVEEEEAKLQKLRPSDRLTAGREQVAIAKRIEQLQNEMRDSTVSFRLRALPRLRFREFLTDHKPREGDDGDRAVGYNRDTYFFDLVRMCLVEPEIDDDQYANLVDNVLSAAQWERIAEAVSTLNMKDVAVPFSATASVLLRNSDETSRRQPAGGSRSSGSTAGNRRKSPSTSTTKKAASPGQ